MRSAAPSFAAGDDHDEDGDDDAPLPLLPLFPFDTLTLPCAPQSNSSFTLYSCH